MKNYIQKLIANEKLSNEELVELLLDNRVDENGDLDLNRLDFTGFKGYILLIGIKTDTVIYVSENIYQYHR